MSVVSMSGRCWLIGRRGRQHATGEQSANGYDDAE